jgi:hypothetical protein
VFQDICALHIQQKPIIRIYRIPGLDILSIATEAIAARGIANCSSLFMIRAEILSISWLEAQTIHGEGEGVSFCPAPDPTLLLL